MRGAGHIRGGGGRALVHLAALALASAAAAPTLARAIDPAGEPTPFVLPLAPVAPPTGPLAAPLEPSGATSGAATMEPSATTTGAAMIEPSAATTGAALEPTAATTAGPPPIRVETSLQPGETGWLDVGHAYIERRIFQPVLWVDRFFADERDTEPQRSRSFVRVRQEVNYTQFRTRPGFGTSFNANLKFPSLDERLERYRIEMVGETRDALTAFLQGDRNPQGELVSSPDQQFGTTDAGLGVRLWESLQTYGDLGAGVMLKLPPGLYTRARLRFVEPFGNAFLARQALTGFWRTDTHLGATGSAELERPITFMVGALWRLSGTTTITQAQVDRGFQWAGDLSLIATLFLRIGGQLGYGVSGATKAPVGVDVYRVYLRLRRDVFRKWIFVELAPEYQWPWLAAIGHRIGFWDVALRFEIQFQGRQAVPERPPPDAEPQDPASHGSLPAPPTTR